jgi:hypothetical protein
MRRGARSLLEGADFLVERIIDQRHGADFAAAASAVARVFGPALAAGAAACRNCRAGEAPKLESSSVPAPISEAKAPSSMRVCDRPRRSERAD